MTVEMPARSFKPIAQPQSFALYTGDALKNAHASATIDTVAPISDAMATGLERLAVTSRPRG
jgi:hypothetical protein